MRPAQPPAKDKRPFRTKTADRAIALVALAYGYGQHLEDVADAYVAPARRWTPTDRRTGDGDENNPAVTSGFCISQQSETLMQASRAINPKDARQAQLLAKGNALEVKAAQAWSDANKINPKGRGLAYRVSEFEHWKTITAVVMVPRARPSVRVLEALADAKLTGPLESLLMLAGTLDPRYWPKVKLHLAACGHPEWACDEAGLLIVLGEWRRSQRRTRLETVTAPPQGATELPADFRLAYAGAVRLGYCATREGACCPYTDGSPEATAWAYGKRWAERRAEPVRVANVVDDEPQEGRSQRERAKALCMRVKDYADAIHAASDRLEEWLHRAGVSVLRALARESNVLQNFGDASASMSETWLYPDRYPAPEVMALRNAAAAEYCRRTPSQPAIYPPASAQIAEQQRIARLQAAIERQALEIAA